MTSFDFDCYLFPQAAVSNSQRKGAGGGGCVRLGWFVGGVGLVWGGWSRLVQEGEIDIFEFSISICDVNDTPLRFATGIYNVFKFEAIIKMYQRIYG